MGQRGSRSVAELDAFLHLNLSSAAEPEEVGPFTLFRPSAPETSYARPRPGAATATRADLVRLDGRCRDLDLPISLAWVEAVAPGLQRLSDEHGLRSGLYPLLTQDLTDVVTPRPPSEISVEVIGSDSPLLAPALATMSVAFGTMTTDPGDSGLAEQRLMMRLFTEGRLRATAERLESGRCVLAVALDAEGEVVACGQYQSAGGTAEVLAMATLPTHRRLGFGAAVIRLLLDHGRARGIEVALLTAESDRSASIYLRAGFQHAGQVGRAGS